MRQLLASAEFPRFRVIFPAGVALLLLMLLVLVQGSGNASQISAQVNGLTGAENIYTVQYYYGTTYRIDPAGGGATQLADLASARYWINQYDNAPQDEEGNAYFVSDRGDVARISSDGTATTFSSISSISSFGRLFRAAMVRDAAGNLYAADYYGGVAKITPDGTASLFADLRNFGSWGWWSLEIAPDGTLYALQYSDRLVKITPDGTVSLVANLASTRDWGWFSFEIAPDGILYALQYEGYLAEITPDGTVSVSSDLRSIQDSQWRSLEIGPDGIVYALGAQGLVVEIGTGGAASLLADLSSIYPWGWYNFAIAPDGTFYAVSERGYVAKIDPQTRQASLLAGRLAHGWGYYAISVPAASGDPDNDGLIGADDNCALIWNLNQANADGDRTGNVCDNLPEDPNDNQDSLVGVTQGSGVNIPRRIFRAASDQLAFTMKVPQSKTGVESHSALGFSTPYVAIKHDGQDVIPYYIVQQPDTTYEVRWMAVLDAPETDRLADPDADDLAGDQAENIIRAVPGVTYGTDGDIEYAFGNHSFTAGPLDASAPAPLGISYTYEGWGSVALGDEVTVNVNVTDPDGNPYNSAYVFATFENPDGTNDYTDRLDLAGSGAYEGTVNIPKMEQTGTWKLVIVAVDRAGTLMPGFGAKDVPVKLTHFTGGASVGAKLYDLTYELTEDNEATITITNIGTVTITEEVTLQWSDLYKFYLEVKSAGMVVASRTFQPWVMPMTRYAIEVTLDPGQSRTYDVKGYHLSATVDVGSQPPPGSPYHFEAAGGSGRYDLDVTITNPAPVDHTAPFVVMGLYDTEKAVLYRDGVPTQFFDVEGDTIVFEDTIGAGETVRYEVKALSAEQLASGSADYHLPKTYKIGIQFENSSDNGIENPRAYVVWTPESAVELVTSGFIGCITNTDKKTGACRPLTPGEKKHIQWNFKALEAADVKATMWADGDNMIPQSKEVVFTVSP